MSALPERLFPPDQLPEASQLSALSVVQLNTVEPLYAKFKGLADKFTTGPATGAFTVMSTWSFAVPPEPVQERLKSVFEVKASIVVEPEVALFPDQPPDAVQLLALVLLQVKVVEPW